MKLSGASKDRPPKHFRDQSITYDDYDAEDGAGLANGASAWADKSEAGHQVNEYDARVSASQGSEGWTPLAGRPGRPARGRKQDGGEHGDRDMEMAGLGDIIRVKRGIEVSRPERVLRIG